LLDGIQDNYIYAQPGIHRQVRALRDLTKRIDSALANHLEQEGVEFMQFSFRWMNCLLMREMSIRNTIRMWDTYMVCFGVMLSPDYYFPDADTLCRPRSRASLDSTFMFVLHSWLNGQINWSRWISR
jgi:hypothetical protein